MLTATVAPNTEAADIGISTMGPIEVPRKHRLRRLIGILAAAVALTVVTGACTPQQNEALTLINNSRSSARLNTLAWDGTLAAKAQSWAEYLAKQGKLSHSNLASGVPSGWKLLGENVGYGGSISEVHSAYMKSPGHKANILNSKFTHVGTGVAKASNGRIYTVHVFMQR